MYEQRFGYAVQKICRTLEISRSGYYEWIRQGRPRKEDKDVVILAAIRKVERENDNNYGVRRVHRSLKEDGYSYGRSKVQRVMHYNGIKAQIKSKYKPQTTKSDPNEKSYPNVLNQDFEITEKNKVWLADITYIRVAGQWAYMAAVLDLGRRKLVGWAVGSSPNTSLAFNAIKQAVQKEKPESGLIHHSDRGCQYTSIAYKKYLEKNKMVGSMSRKGNPYDNAPMESFFQTLKTEFIYKHRFHSVEHAAHCLRQWINYYNTVRLHSALCYKSPLSYEIQSNHPFVLSA